MAGPPIPYYMNYVIFFNDPSEYAIATAIAGGNLLKLAPRDAATLLGIPFPYPSGDMNSIPRGIYFIFPYVPGQQIGFPGPSGVFVDDTVLTVTVAGQAGVPASIWPAGPDATFTWSGNIVKNGGAGVASDPPANVMSQRRWAVGFESMQENSTVISNGWTRDASRTIDGGGLAVRGNSFNSPYTQLVAQYRTGLTTRTSWERFYMRFRRLPASVASLFWYVRGNISPAAGAGLRFETTGDVTLQDIDAVGTQTSKGTVWTPTLNQWYRVDVFLRYGNGSGSSIVSIYINGVLTKYQVMTSMNANSQHSESRLGQNSGVDAEVEYDMDDWINADLPANVSQSDLTFQDSNFPIDWLLGSHCRGFHSVSGSQVNWTPAGGVVGSLNMTHSPAGHIGTTGLSTSTPSATVEGVQDILPLDVPDSLFSSIGVVAVTVNMYSVSTDGSDGQLAYRVAGGAVQGTVTVPEQGTDQPTSTAYLPSGQIFPADIAPFSVVHNKSGTAANNTVFMLTATAEYLGVWGPEDDSSFVFPVSRNSNLHNCLYGNTAWGYLGSQPAAPVYAIGGTYVGNGSYQEITLPAPCHFLWIRPLTTPSGGIKMLQSGIPHTGSAGTSTGNVRMWYDFVNGLFKFSVTGGAGSECNVSGNTFQYIAFCDPGMRYCLGANWAHGGSSSTPKVNNLIVSDFTPLAAFFTRDFNGNTGTRGLYYRGAGHTANNATDLNISSGPDATCANFATGIINSFATLHSGNGNCSYLAFREADSGADGCAGNKMITITSYTGNNTNPRTIAIGSGSGRFPLFVMVCPATSGSTTAVFRDPSHTGTNSSNVDTMTLNPANGITAVGVDSITVQSNINTNGVVYSVFIIWGDTAAMNNGTFNATYCDGDGPYFNPNPPSTSDINVIGNGGLVLDGAPSFTLLVSASGIYTIVPGKTADTLINRGPGGGTIDVKIPDPTWKTGYLGG